MENTTPKAKNLETHLPRRPPKRAYVNRSLIFLPVCRNMPPSRVASLKSLTPTTTQDAYRIGTHINTQP